MSKVRYLNTRFWSDSWIVDELNPLDRYLFLYLLSNERTTVSGIYELPIRTIANEIGLEKDEVTRMIKRLEPKVYYRNGWVVMAKAIRHQNYKSPKIRAAIERELCNVPTELIELLSPPQDFDMNFSCPIDKKEYGIDTVSYTKPNLTKPNLTNSTNVLVAPAKPEPRPRTNAVELLKLINAELHGSTQMIITDTRKRKLADRLKVFTAKQLVEAAKYMGNDPHLQGDNDRGKRYGTIDFFLRNNEKIAEYLEEAQESHQTDRAKDLKNYA